MATETQRELVKEHAFDVVHPQGLSMVPSPELAQALRAVLEDSERLVEQAADVERLKALEQSVFDELRDLFPGIMLGVPPAISRIAQAKAYIERCESEITTLRAQVETLKRERDEAVARAFTTERFRREDAASHCEDQIVSAKALQHFKAELARLKGLAGTCRMYRAEVMTLEGPGSTTSAPTGRCLACGRSHADHNELAQLLGHEPKRTDE